MENIIKKVLKKIIDAGYEAYLVGGYVRDSLLGIEAFDIDITTNALPNDIVEIFDKVYLTGIKYGTVTVLISGYTFEITTYRLEDNYINNRKPSEIVYTSDLKSDLKRRDFTINALCLNYNYQLIDFFNGKDDLNNKIIKAIGEPNSRFEEDALRMLRAIRFKSKLGFEIEENTFQAIIKNRDLLNNVSIERIRKELMGILKGEYYLEIIENLIEINFDFLSCFELPNFKIDSLNDREVYALLYHLKNFNLGKYKLSNNEKSLCLKVDKFLNKAKINNLDIYDNLKILDSIEKIYNLINNNKIDFTLLKKKLVVLNKNEIKIDGKILKEFGYNGKIVGTILKKIEEEIVLRKLENKKEVIEKFVRREYRDTKY